MILWKILEGISSEKCHLFCYFMGIFKKHFQIWRQLGVAGHYILSSHLKPNSPVTSVIQSYLGLLFKIIFSKFETKSNSKRHTIWLTVTDSSHKVSTIKSIYINMKIYLLKDLSKNLIKYTNSLLARVKCECYSLVGHLQTLFRHVTADLLRRN